MIFVPHCFSIADMWHSQAPIIHPTKPEGSVLEFKGLYLLSWLKSNTLEIDLEYFLLLLSNIKKYINLANVYHDKQKLEFKNS